MSFRRVNLAGRTTGKTYSNRTGFNHWFRKGQNNGQTQKSSQLTPKPDGADSAPTAGNLEPLPAGKQGMEGVRSQEGHAIRLAQTQTHTVKGEK